MHGLLLHAAESAAAKDRVNTIKPRHLAAISSVQESTEEDGSQTEIEIQEDILEGQISGSALTPAVIRKMAKSFAGMPVTDGAIEELMMWYYEVVDETGQNIREHAQLGSNPANFIDALDKMKELMMLGWIRRMLVKAAEDAEERGYKRIDVEQLINLDPFE